MGEKQNKTLIKRNIKILLYNIKVYVHFMNFIKFTQKIKKKSLFLVARQRNLAMEMTHFALIKD